MRHRTGTVLAESRLPLQKWLLGIYMITGTRMAREPGVTQKTAWFPAQRIRETCVGGKECNEHANKKLHARRGTVGKTAVAGGEVRAMPVGDITGPVLKGRPHAPEGATVVADRHKGYSNPNQNAHWPRYARRAWWGKPVTGLVHDTLDDDVAKDLKENKPAPDIRRHRKLTGNYGIRQPVSRCYEVIGMAKTCDDIHGLRQRVA